MNFYFLLILLLLIIIVLYRLMGGGNRFIFLSLILVSLGLYFGIQEETEPNYIKVDSNTNVTGTVLQIDANTYAQCPQDQTIQPSKKNESHLICYNPAPLGHVQITSPQLFAFLLTIAALGGLTVHGIRDFYSSKIYIFENRYQEELRPISKIADIHRQKGYRWTWAGYSYLLEWRSNDVYVSTDYLSEEIGKHFIMKGSILRVDHQALFVYLKKDLKLIRELLRDPKITLNNGKIDNFNPNIKIYVTIPIKGEKSYTFLSLKGKYDFHHDRFMVTIRNLFKMLDGLFTAYDDTVAANQSMIDDAKKNAQGTAVMADAYGRTKKANIVRPESYQSPEDRQRREQM